jgi:hypothetical protein
VRRVRRADNLTTIYANCLDNVGSLTSHNPIGLQGLLRGQLYLLPLQKTETNSWKTKNKLNLRKIGCDDGKWTELSKDNVQW